MTLGIGVVGTGQMGRYHVERLRPTRRRRRGGGRLRRVRRGAKQVAEQVGARAYSDGHELIADDRVQAVLIASLASPTRSSPWPAWPRTSRCCARSRWPRPSTPACRVLEAEAAKPRRLIQVGFMRRYDDGFQALKAATDLGRVGRPLLLHCRHRNADDRPGFTSDMMITDSVVHDIDVTRWLLGQEIVAATVFQGRPSSLAADGLQDPQMSVLETSDGVLVDVESFVLPVRLRHPLRAGRRDGHGRPRRAQPASRSAPRAGTTADRPTTGSGSATPTRTSFEWVSGVVRAEVVGPSAWDGYATTAVAEAAVES